MVDKPISFEDWVATVLFDDLNAGQRIGQSYMNHVRPSESDPSLFYETDTREAWRKIYEKEKDG